MGIKFEERDMTEFEYKEEQRAFDKYGLEFGNPPEKQKRIGVVATDERKFVGASSGLVQTSKGKHHKYCFN